MSHLGFEFNTNGKDTIFCINNSNENSTVNVNLSFCLDISGSMDNIINSNKYNNDYISKLDLCKTTLKYIVSKIANNKVGLVTFGSNS